MPAQPCLSDNVIKQVCHLLAYYEGASLTHAEIGYELKKHNLQDTHGTGINKQNRLINALLSKQREAGCSNNILAFIQDVVEPVKFTGRREIYDSFRAELNQVLLFASLMIREDGKLIKVTAATTLDEAAERGNRLRKRLKDMAVHVDVIKCCQTELIRDSNYFHTVLEAAKSVAKKIRDKTNRTEDGHELVDATLFAGKESNYPLLAINRYQTPSEQSAQKGFAFFVKGMFSMFRNPTAHDPKSIWEVSEEEALEFLVLASLLHRKIDNAYLTQTTELQ